MQSKQGLRSVAFSLRSVRVGYGYDSFVGKKEC